MVCITSHMWLLPGRADTQVLEGTVSKLQTVMKSWTKSVFDVRIGRSYNFTVNCAVIIHNFLWKFFFVCTMYTKKIIHSIFWSFFYAPCIWKFSFIVYSTPAGILRLMYFELLDMCYKYVCVVCIIVPVGFMWNVFWLVEWITRR